MFIDAVSAADDVFGLAQDKRGRGPLHYAASKASVESVRLILGQIQHNILNYLYLHLL